MKKYYTILILLYSMSGSAGGADIPRWMVLTLQGEEMVRGGKYEQGLDFFLQAERIQEHSTRLYMNLAVCYKFLAEHTPSSEQRKEYYFTFIAYVKKVLALEPLHPDARYLLDKHLGMIPENIPFHNNEAREFYKAGRDAMKTGSFEAAQGLFAKGLEAERHPDILKSLAVLHYRRKEYTDAAHLLRESVGLNTVQHDAYMILGEIAEQKNRLNEAKAYYIKALASYPNYFPAREKISLINKKTGRDSSFFFLMDPVPAEQRTIAPDAEIKMRRLAERIEVNMFQLQCWLVYHRTVREAKASHREKLPGSVFTLTPEIEVEAVGTMLLFYVENREKKGVTLKQFDILYSLMQKGLLKPAVFFYRWRDEFADAFVQYRTVHFDDLCRMFEEHL